MTGICAQNQTDKEQTDGHSTERLHKRGNQSFKKLALSNSLPGKQEFKSSSTAFNNPHPQKASTWRLLQVLKHYTQKVAQFQ